MEDSWKMLLSTCIGGSTTAKRRGFSGSRAGVPDGEKKKAAALGRLSHADFFGTANQHGLACNDVMNCSRSSAIRNL